MSKKHVIVLLVTLVAAIGAPAAAQKLQPQDLAGLSMEELLKIEVTGASKFPRDVTEAPASITVITSEDIRRYGHRSLADVLRSIRGIYTTYDRNYTYVGVRGMARPGDYNTRVLLLVDGHRINDGIYDMAPIGTDFPIDLSMVERVEVIRGPASSVYGTSAFFGVINVVTRTGSERRRTQVEVDGGTLGTSRVSASYGKLFGDGREMLLSATRYGSAGQARIFYPEYADTAAQGIARNLDDDRSVSLSGSYRVGRISIRGAFGDRLKDIPTGSYGTAFGDARSHTVDRRGFLDVAFDGAIAPNWKAVGRVAYDYYAYDGHYPYDYGEPGVVMFDDLSVSQVASAELAVQRAIGRHRFTFGGESRFQLRSHQWNTDAYYGPQLDVNEPKVTAGAFVEDEWRLASWMLATAGVRVDRLSSYGSRATPRLSLVLLPRDGMSIKLLHGRAFRAPNDYELFYYNTQANHGFPEVERMSSTELVWEQTVNDRVRATVSAFSYAIDGLIEQRAIEGSDDLDDLFFANGQGMRGKGVEFELESRFDNGVVARVSHALTDVNDSATAAQISNSPRNLSKLAAQVPLGRFALGMEGQYIGRRYTLAGEPIGAAFVPNIALTSSYRRIGVLIGVYNVFNRTYFDPGAEEHAQHSIQQDGRTALARLRVTF